MKRILIIGFLVMLIVGLQAQKQANLWYFGHHAGMDFNNTQTVNSIPNLPTFTTGPINTYEGCFSISDNDGNLLFVSDGSTVYDKNQHVMQNGTGLYGDLSSTNAGLVIPMPGSTTKYYIFTVPGREWSLNLVPGNPRPGIPAPGLCYSIVDMNENGELGAIVEKNINIPLKGSNNGTPVTYDKKWVAENITATGHENGKDYWILTRIKRYFFAYLVTSEGISETAVISDIGNDVDEVNKRPGTTEAEKYSMRGMGYIKISPNGTRVAQCDINSRYFTRGKFDNKTGIVSDIKTSEFPTNNWGPYGVEFSRDSKYMYIASLQSIGICVQETDVYNQFLTWSTTLGTTANFKVSTLQLGSDGRIYGIGGGNMVGWNAAAGEGSPNLYVILDPDEGGTNAMIIPNFFQGINRPDFGLPPFLTSYFGAGDLEIDPPGCCINQLLTFSMYVSPGTGINAITKLEWDFGDGSPIVTDTEMGQLMHTQQHIYTKLGKYTFSLTPYKTDGTVVTEKIQTKEVKINSCLLPINPNIHQY